MKYASGVRSARIYEILYYRYVEQLSQKEVAYQLGISVRQLRREQANAIEYLADRLWSRYNLAESPGAQQETPSPPIDERESLDREIAWLRDGFRAEVSHPAAELSEALRDAAVLAERYRVKLQQEIPPNLPKAAVPPLALRQAFLTVLTAVIPPSADQSLKIMASEAETSLFLSLRQTGEDTQERVATGCDLTSLDIASKLLSPFGGQVAMVSPHPLHVEITIPIVGSIPILLVDDNPDARRLLERYAASSRFRLITTGEWSQIIPLARRFRVHAIVLDVMMPEADGWDILAQLHHHPDTQDIPIVICTILPQRELADLLGATAFVQKPVTQQAFLKALEEVTSERRGPD
ncbi:MAG TPA: response regulator [Caldilineae bacterium]|nr:response regulator [Caldilineae bacterium]